jgi:SAM-dependent methyltransferase
MFPNAEIVGIELEERLLSIAVARAAFYGFSNLSFRASPAPNRLPDAIGAFDFVMLSAVYEHMLPDERKALLPLIWSTLKAGGILFLNGTPNRDFPLEMHTTGLPAINYLPDKLACFISRRFSRRNLENVSWEGLLRGGIRGGTIREIVRNLSSPSGTPRVLEPQYLGIKDRIDLWLALTSQSIGRVRSPRALLAKRIYRLLIKPVRAITGIEFLPELALAFEKT